MINRRMLLIVVILAGVGLGTTMCGPSPGTDEGDKPSPGTDEGDKPSPGTDEGDKDIQVKDSVQDEFDSDLGTFPLGVGMQILDGEYLLGPFDECANDVQNFDDPVDCNAVCQSCGTDISNYHLKAQAAFKDGISEREYGVILRFVDEDGDGMLDYEDYLLAFGIDTFNSKFHVYVHIPNDLDPWHTVASGHAPIRIPPRRPNHIEVVASNDGQTIEIIFNQESIVTLTGGTAQSGERFVEEWASSGAVGLVTLGRGVQASFDNFSFESMP